MAYELVIGLETHVELSTESKLFCSCGGHAKGSEPNDCVCPACSGMPGMLPVVNKHAIELAVKAGIMLNCEISKYTTFDKKSYYYPDLPASYQTTQWFNPICKNGLVEVETPAGIRKIGIKQIHVEEDAGKLVHTATVSLVDYNRTGVPLIEIVTRPDFRSAEEVITYLKTLKSKLQFAGISECEEGAMRCDVNISVRPEGEEKLGVRTEIKNMSSLTAIEEAINKEAIRHIDAIERGTDELVQETRRWDDVKKRTTSMRNKETAADYRYFPDPNVMPVIIDDEWMAAIRASMPATTAEIIAKYVSMGIPGKEAKQIVAEVTLSSLLDKLIELGIDAKTASAWIITDCVGILRKNGKHIKDLSIEPSKLAAIIRLVSEGRITRGSGKTVLAEVLETGADPEKICEAKDLFIRNDAGALEEVCRKVLGNNAAAVEDYRSGKTKAFQSLFGGVMRELHGTGDPAVIRSLLEKLLSE